MTTCTSLFKSNLANPNVPISPLHRAIHDRSSTPTALWHHNQPIIRQVVCLRIQLLVWLRRNGEKKKKHREGVQRVVLSLLASRIQPISHSCFYFSQSFSRCSQLTSQRTERLQQATRQDTAEKPNKKDSNLANHNRLTTNSQQTNWRTQSKEPKHATAPKRWKTCAPKHDWFQFLFFIGWEKNKRIFHKESSLNAEQKATITSANLHLSRYFLLP